MDRDTIRDSFLRIGESLARAAALLDGQQARLDERQADINRRYDDFYIRSVANGQRGIARLHLSREVIRVRAELGLPIHKFNGLDSLDACQHIDKFWSPGPGAFETTRCGKPEVMHR